MAKLMRWTAPHKASRCRRVIVGDESPERAVHDKAPDFYRRHEYIEFGRIEDYPPGHTRLWFMKRF